MNKKVIDKNYGSIPHLSTSKLHQQADKKIHEGQEKILTQKARDWKDLIVVTEKLDGCNVGIIAKDGDIHAVTRSGYLCSESPYIQHKLFYEYVNENILNYVDLREGWRIAGEWMPVAHGTIYDISDLPLFLAFDIFNEKNERLAYIDFLKWTHYLNVETVPLLHIGQPISIDNAIKLMGKGHYGECDQPEGFVYRCERQGSVEFLAKWVHQNKEDGKYLKSNEVIYNTGVRAW